MAKQTHDITVVIPTIPPRADKLRRALASVHSQTYAPADIIVRADTERVGAPGNRNTALHQVTTDWVAFLDDDDEFKPGHLDCLVAAQQESGADYVYAWYDVVGGVDPLPHFGKTFDHCSPTQTTVTTLVRTELAKEAGFVLPLTDELTPDGNTYGEDYAFTIRCVELGGYVFHTPHRTWFWHHWSDSTGSNTSGRPDRWSSEDAQQAHVQLSFARF